MRKNKKKVNDTEVVDKIELIKESDVNNIYSDNINRIINNTKLINYIKSSNKSMSSLCNKFNLSQKELNIIFEL